MKAIGIGFIVASVLSVPCFMRAAPSTGTGEIILFPGDNFVEGWLRKGEAREFTANALYGHIDGGSELFLEYGFQVLRLQKYHDGTDEISVEVYRMTGPEAALGIYLMKCGNETPVPGITARNTGDFYQITILKGDNFVTVNNFNGKPQFLPVMVKLAEKTLENLPDTKPSDLFSLLPPEDRVKGSELLIRGMYSLQSLYTLGEGDILLLGNKIFGVTAQYKDTNNHIYNRLVVRYPDEAYAQKAFSHLCANLDSYIRVQEKRNDCLRFKDYKEKSGEIFLKGDTLHIFFNL